jgi:hypothetical protein
MSDPTMKKKLMAPSSRIACLVVFALVFSLTSGLAEGVPQQIILEEKEAVVTILINDKDGHRLRRIAHVMRRHDLHAMLVEDVKYIPVKRRVCLHHPLRLVSVYVQLIGNKEIIQRRGTMISSFFTVLRCVACSLICVTSPVNSPIFTLSPTLKALRYVIM